MIVLKNSKELALMKQAGKITAEALWAGVRACKPGTTTWEINRVVHETITSRGATPSFLGLYGFPAAACISVNEELIHGIPDKKHLIKEGDIVSIDVGACIGGYHGDSAYTVGVGEIAPETKQLLEVTQECLNRGIAAALKGNRLGDIGSAVQTYAVSYGYGGVREYVGHGVGRKMHEDPEVPNYGHQGRGPRLVPGMTIAIEPMICQYDYKIKQLSDGWTVKTKDGGLAAHFEHSIAILKDHTEIMTKSWDDPDFDPSTFSFK